MGCGSFALLGFPLDDIWHRLFGQDVTLWGPTHLMLIGGAGLSLFAVLGLIAEGRASLRAGGAADDEHVSSLRRGRALRLTTACGGLLIGLSVYQGEFDFGVAQFRLLYDPVLITLAASVALVTARMLGGRGTALSAAVFFLVVRGAIALIVGGPLGEVTPHFPLYLVEALLVEGVAVWLPPRGSERPGRSYLCGAVAGALIGSVGVVAEYGWAGLWMPVAWPAHTLPEAIALSLPVGVAGGVLGAFAGGALRLRANTSATPRAWAAAAASLLAIAAVVAFLSHNTVPADARAAVTLTDVRPGAHRTVAATVRFDPPAAVRDADWLMLTAWQGHAKAVVQPMRRIADGVYAGTSPLPVYGSWKAMIRVHRGPAMGSIPIYFPADRAIPVAGIPARDHFVRRFVADRVLLQRERKHGVPGWLWPTASSVVLSLYIGLLALLGWGLARLAGSGGAVERVRRGPVTGPGPERPTVGTKPIGAR
jgi:hypothetical protein